MFQTFEETAEPKAAAARVAALRQEMARRGLAAYLIPRSDEFQGEYVAPYAERLRWLSGFTGSAGLLIVTAEDAILFVDGRYTVQVRVQTDAAVFGYRHLVDEPPSKWLPTALKAGDVVGYDPWLMTADTIARFRPGIEKAGATLEPVEPNLIDVLWRDQPARPMKPIETQPTQYAGTAADAKLDALQRELGERGVDALVMAMPDCLAWLFNVRGQDVPHTPVVLAHAIAPKQGRAAIFIDPAKVPDDVVQHLSRVADVKPVAEFMPALDALGTAKATVLLDPVWTSEAIRSRLADAGATVVNGQDPSILPKARKNHAEREGARAAQRRDGAAVSRFLHWLDREAPKGGLDEIAATQALEQFRRDTGELCDVSFDTIAGAGPHAAIPHYKVTTASNRRIGIDEIFLIDSGGQYRDGTTDITRTIIVGTPRPEMRDRFTRVLKGMIALSRLRFPKGTMGGHLDAFARSALWQAGLDYDHGTGHGVGSYLSVHEGPARFSKADRTVLEPGMILSNEPGYYREGDFGIRIENLLLVTEPSDVEGGERPMMGFETLTLAPIDRRLIVPSLLTPEELAWLNDYHARVLREVGPFLDGADLAWLKQATAPLSASA
ncbi:MAG: aminopeptidase P family protein [Hyphomicrobiales bacterium]